MVSATPHQSLKVGNDALRQGDYQRAIASLLHYCENAPAQGWEYGKAQMALVKAYQASGQTEMAIALCQQLMTSEVQALHIWATKFLGDIAIPAPSASDTTLNPEGSDSDLASHPAEILERIEFKSVDQFRQFCHQELADDLRDFEKTRKQVLTQISLVGGFVTALAVVIFGVGLYWVTSMLPKDCAASRQSAEPRLNSLKLNNGDRSALQLPDRLPSPDPTLFLTQSSFIPFLASHLLASNRPRVRYRHRSEHPYQTLMCDDPAYQQAMVRLICQTLVLPLGGMTLCLLVGVAFYSASTETYARGFKGKIIHRIVEFIVPWQGLTYRVKGSDSETLETLMQSRLFPSLNRQSYVSQDDHIAGTIGKTQIAFSEVRTEAEVAGGLASRCLHFVADPYRGTPVDSSFTSGLLGNWTVLATSLPVLGWSIKILRGIPYVVNRIRKGQRIDFEHFNREVIAGTHLGRHVFKGLFFVADFNKTFRGKTFLFSKAGSANIQTLHSQKGTQVRLEDPQFNQRFVVYGNDQVEARYILSTSLMNRLVNFSQKADRKMQIAFVDSMIFIAIAYEEDLFEPRLFKTMLDLRPIQEYFEILQMMLAIVDDLNLNQRIWTKQ
ncbi:MAG: DUF3137 domain-containing protein [Oculatellaceae cyanobacterium Prado106]|jgi:hypothetical protein|nr:DUF3137 domain-containing protein [Oculatellaceae cyanobacterium Prado106]